jgi:hypothetical protein
VVATFHDVKKVGRVHFRPDIFKKIKGTKKIARPLDKENRLA